MIRIASPEARRIAARHFEEKEPFLLELLKAFSPVEMVEYEGRAEKELKAELMQARKQAAESGIKKARSALKNS